MYNGIQENLHLQTASLLRSALGPPGNAVPYTGRMDQTKVEV